MPITAWIISAGAYIDFDLAAIGIDAKPKRVMAYHLSDIGRYLISPRPIDVENRLMGCECYFKPIGWKRIRRGVARLIPLKSKRNIQTDQDYRRLFIARRFVRIPSLQDRQLAQHVERLRGMLQPYDPVVQEIAAIDVNRLEDMRGVCEDEGGHRTYINLNGDLETKHRYVIDNLLARVPITLQNARIAKGLYEMRGLRPDNYHEERQHRLLRFQVNGRFFACLLSDADKVVFWLDDVKYLQHLLLLQQAIETNLVLKSAIEDCLQGDARPLRLMLNHDMDIDYSRNRMPQIYRELFHSLRVDATKQKGIIRSLNTDQMGVSFSYVPLEGFGDPRPITSISVLHDVKALETVRQAMPQLYAEISRKATQSEAGKYYLLESIKGRPDENGL
jgi:hypothetical protein